MKNNSKKIAETVKNIVGNDNIKENEPMSRHSSMEVGGPAALYITPEDKHQLAGVIAGLRLLGENFYIIGNASNVIVVDEGFDGAIVSTEKLMRIKVSGNTVEAQSGAMLKDIARVCMENSLAGFEFASGIPGSLGGAICMNAGAYDGEMKDVTAWVELLDTDGNLIRKNCEEMEFSYRHSICSLGGYIVTEAMIELEPGDKQAISRRIEELSLRRKEKQPLEYPSCGSTFKRPEGYFAGKLITDAGLKGMTRGGAQVSEKHAGFIINKNNASAADVIGLIETVKEKVREVSGVELECEVRIVR